MVITETDRCQCNEKKDFWYWYILFFVYSHSTKVDRITFHVPHAVPGTRDTDMDQTVSRHWTDEGRLYVNKRNDDVVLTQKYDWKGDCYGKVAQRKERLIMPCS